VFWVSDFSGSGLNWFWTSRIHVQIQTRATLILHTMPFPLHVGFNVSLKNSEGFYDHCNYFYDNFLIFFLVF